MDFAQKFPIKLDEGSYQFTKQVNMNEVIKEFKCQGKHCTEPNAAGLCETCHAASMDECAYSPEIAARWIAYYNEPTGSFLYLCDACLCETIKENNISFKNRLISVRFLPDALNQIGGTGILSSLPSRT